MIKISEYNERFFMVASLAKLVFPCSLTLTPKNQPHSKTTATAVHLLFANAHAQHRKVENKNEKRKRYKCLHITSGFTQAGVYSRRQFCADLEVYRPPDPLWNPRLREAATTLQAMSGDSILDNL